VLPEIREFERTSTTVVNAYVLPVVQAYLSGLRDRLDAIGVRTPLRMMQSAGGIMDADTAAERPVQVIESGPAAGVVAAAALGSRIGQPDMIALDMGGTTAKAALIEGGRVPRATDYEVGGGISLAGRLMGGGGYPIRVPCIDLAEIGAGGGSLLRLDAGGALQVGPESAGADPGPACYARGGTQPTLTDANLALGYLNPDGLTGGTMPLDADAARRSLSEEVAGPMGLSVEAAALGAHRIAVALMVRAVRAVSAERGRDPRRFEMLAFGGSGPLHAVAMAREMGIARVRIPGAPGLFSAFGLLVAGHQLDRVRSCLRRVSDLTEDEVRDAYREMAEEAEEALPGARLERSADLRYVGQSFELTVPVAGDVQKPGFLAGLREAFEGEHERTYGHRAESDPVEVVAWRLRATLPAPEMPLLEPSVSDGRERTRRAYFGDRDGWIETPVLGRGGLPSEPCTGPMIVEDYDATTLVPPGAEPWLDEWGNIVVDCGRH
jgi:N-methylhydantoinase A